MSQKPISVTQVYVLRDGKWSFYVGSSARLSFRLKQHLDAARKGVRSVVYEHIRAMVAEGRTPEIVPIRDCEPYSTGIAEEGEEIDRLLSQGCKLLNVKRPTAKGASPTMRTRHVRMNDSHSVFIRLTESEFDQLKRIADDDKRSVAWMAHEAVRLLLSRDAKPGKPIRKPSK